MRHVAHSFVFILLLAIGCGEEFSDEVAAPAGGFQMTFEDQFDGPAGNPPDLTKWTFDTGTGVNGWGNQELQFYTGRPENVALDGDGHLVITAIEESFSGAEYTSARIKTLGEAVDFSQRYGRFEARMQLPGPGAGLWPAFWMLGAGFEDDEPWPFVGEIDIMENIGRADTVYGTIHGPEYSGADSIGRRLVSEGTDYTTGFHVFSVDWDPTSIIWRIDGEQFFRVNTGGTPGPWVFDTPFYMILNLAVGGNFPGNPTDATPFPAQLIVDYVRVYERVPQ
ncbi:MAG: glycoside hydrolase family 16 protein [Myxococcota bacterium]